MLILGNACQVGYQPYQDVALEASPCGGPTFNNESLE